MAGTEEGIGGRKWSIQLGDDHHGYGCENDGDVLEETCQKCGAPDRPAALMQGKTKLADLTPEGKRVLQLLVTAPQLWDAANRVMQAREFGGDGTYTTDDERFKLLGQMVAKAVGKDSWKQVAQ